MEAVILIGIQATGKSTFYKQNFFKSHMRINLDMLKTRVKEDILVNACIKVKQPFVIDNTNSSIDERKKYIEISKKAGFSIIGYYFESNIKDAIVRNQSRIGKENIPSKGIEHTYNKLVIPTYDEGFDKLFHVSIGKDDSFVIEEWENEV